MNIARKNTLKTFVPITSKNSASVHELLSLPPRDKRYKTVYVYKKSLRNLASYTVTRRTVKFPYIHIMTPDDNGPGRENISRMRAG